jgi:hypothetical protein
MQLPAMNNGIRGPRLLSTRPDSGLHTSAAAAIGSVHSPACNAE